MEREKVFRRRNCQIHHMKLMYIDTVFEDYVSSENIQILLWHYVVNDDEAPSTSFQIVEETENIKEVVLPAVSKLND